MIRELLALALGIVIGLVTPRLWGWLVVRLADPLPDRDLWTLAKQYELEGTKLLELSRILVRLSVGDDPDEIAADLSPELQAMWEDWCSEHGF